MSRAKYVWVRFSNRASLTRTRTLCTTKPISTTNNNNNNEKVGEPSVRDIDAYRQLDKLDFTTAAKILFTTPPKKKKFGIDFHLVQLFFVLMPSFAVYLVAQYARYEMRKMDAELELKRKAEEENKAKELELSATEEKEKGSDPELSNVKERLEKLEEAIKEIAVESKKQYVTSISKNLEGGTEKKQTEPNNTQRRPEASNSASQERVNNSAPVADTSQQDQRGKIQNEEPSQAAKK